MMAGVQDDAGQAPFFPGFRSGTIDAEGVSIHYVTGGSGPPLLLVHGAPQSHIMWRRVAPLLRQHRTLVIPDLRGYGRSDKPARGDYSKRRMAADLIAVMDALGHASFDVAGHDRGARVTRRLVKDWPARIRRAVLLDIVPTAYIYANLSPRVMANLWNWSMWAAREPVPETILDPQALLRLTLRSVAPGPEALADYLETNGNAESLHAMCEDYRAGASVDLAHDAADAGTRIAAPLLVLTGRSSASTETLFDVAAAWRGEADDIRFASLDCGHFLPEELPAETARAMLDFLRADQPAQASAGRVRPR